MKNVVRVSLITLVALALASCMMPEAQLEFAVSNPVFGNGDMFATVSYTLTNIGSKDLSNAMIRIDVDAENAAGGPVWSQAWTSGHDLTAYGGEATGSVQIYFSSAIYNAASSVATVTGSAWDTDDSSGGFFF